MNFLSLPILAVLLLYSPVATAATITAEDDLSIAVPVKDDLYAAGGTVHVRESVVGDALVAGGDVNISGDIEQDLIAVGGDVDVDANVGDDVRIGAGTIALSASVRDDAFLFGNQVTVHDDSVINGDLRVFGDDVVIEGVIHGNVYIRATTARVTGKIDGSLDVESKILDMNAEVGQSATLSAKQFSVSQESLIGGDVSYWQPQGEYTFGEGVVRGTPTYDNSLKMHNEIRKATAGLSFGLFVYSLFASSLVILLAMFFTRSYFVDAAKRLLKAPGMSIWYGFLYIIVAPSIAILCMLTFIGIPIGLFLIIAYIFTFFFVKPITSIIFARVIELRYKKKWSSITIFFVSVLIFVVWKLLVLVPIVGSITSLLAVLAGFGVLSHTKWTKFMKIR